MKGDFCRMCGSKKLRQQKRDIFIASQKKWVKAVRIWICENCSEEFLDDSSWEQLYKAVPIIKRRRTMAA
jgi:YgiT-type zinc finger domain-containing protein